MYVDMWMLFCLYHSLNIDGISIFIGFKTQKKKKKIQLNNIFIKEKAKIKVTTNYKNSKMYITLFKLDFFLGQYYMG